MDDPAPTPSQPILLVGMPGSGKSTIGPQLAGRLRLPFHDTDAIIEARLEMRIAHIFARFGEGAFRAEEKALVTDLLVETPAVIAAGGGAFLDQETRAFALVRATTIWLDADLATLSGRLGGASDRPLLGDEGRLSALKKARDPVYALASIRIDASGSADRVVAAILAALSVSAR